jgi:hypothetical protein
LLLLRYNKLAMAAIEQEQKLLKAKVAVALYGLLGRVPKSKEVDRVFLLIRSM